MENRIKVKKTMYGTIAEAEYGTVRGLPDRFGPSFRFLVAGGSFIIDCGGKYAADKGKGLESFSVELPHVKKWTDDLLEKAGVRFMCELVGKQVEVCLNEEGLFEGFELVLQSGADDGGIPNE